MKNKSLRIVFFLHWTNICLIILFSFIIPFLRREAGFSTSLIFLYSIIISGATVLGGYYTKFFADRMGSKPLMFIGLLALCICFTAWVFIPAGAANYIILFLGFITAFFLFTNEMLVGRVTVRNLPEKDTVSYSAMINFIAAIVSAGVGTGGGLLADRMSYWNLPLANRYSLTFAIAIIIGITALILSIRLSEPESSTKREVMGILLSPANLQSFRMISRLETEKDPVSRQTILLHIGKTDNPLTTKEIHSIIANPLSSDKGEVIKSLFNFPRPAILPDLISVAENPSSRYRVEAIFALGAYHDNKAIKLLDGLITNSNPEVRSNAAKSLARLGEVKHIETIRKQAEEASGIWNRMNYIIALKNIDREGLYLGKIFNNYTLSQNRQYRQTIYSLYADIIGAVPKLDDIYQKRNLNRGDGLTDFLDEARDVQGFLASRDDFVSWLDSNNSKSVCLRCAELLENTQVTEKLIYLKGAISGLSPSGRDYDDALAVIYFTYHLLKNGATVQPYK